MSDADGHEPWAEYESFLSTATALLHNVVRELSIPLQFSLHLIWFRDDAPEARRVEVSPPAVGFSLDAVRSKLAQLNLSLFPPPRGEEGSSEETRAAWFRHQLWRRLAPADIVEAGEVDANRLGWTPFCSDLCSVGDVTVAVLLLTATRDYRAQPFVVRPSANPEEDDEEVSYLQSVIETFLGALADDLSRPEQGRYNSTTANARELLRLAASRFTDHATYGWMTSEARANQFSVGNNLFYGFNVISSLDYERTENRGQMIFAGCREPAIHVVVPLARPVDLLDYRRVRKLLQMCVDDQSLLLDCRNVFGLGRQATFEAEGRPVAFPRIDFQGRHRWSLCYGEKELMSVSYGEARLPLPQFDAPAFRLALRRLSPRIESQCVEGLEALVRASAELRHGTMLVVSKEALAERERLQTSCFPVDPFQLTPEIFRSVSTIDGAILVDLDGLCHAIGVILDGQATKYGDSSRGARFNSARRYFLARRELDRRETGHEHGACVVVVVSDDGMIDVIPPLPLFEDE